jgi:hypothetical protein
MVVCVACFLEGVWGEGEVRGGVEGPSSLSSDDAGEAALSPFTTEGNAINSQYK